MAEEIYKNDVLNVNPEDPGTEVEEAANRSNEIVTSVDHKPTEVQVVQEVATIIKTFVDALQETSKNYRAIPLTATEKRRSSRLLSRQQDALYEPEPPMMTYAKRRSPRRHSRSSRSKSRPRRRSTRSRSQRRPY